MGIGKLMKMSVLVVILLVVMLPVCFAVSVNPESLAVETTDTSATINFETDVNAETSLFYGKTTSSLQQVFEGTPPGVAHEISINNLDENEEYYYQLQAEDPFGTFTSNYFQFATLLPTPTGLVVDSAQNNEVEINWDNVGGADHYKVYLDGVEVGIATRSEYTFEGLLYNSAYAVRVSAVNRDEVESALSSELAIETGIEPVEITFVQVTTITNTSAVVTWLTNLPATSMIAYGSTSTNLDQSESVSTHSTEHSFTLNGLDPNTNYYFRVISGESETTVDTFRTLSGDEVVRFFDFVVSDITMNSAEVTWKTDVETRGDIRYSIDDSFQQVVHEQHNEVNHHEELTSLLGGMTYYYKVVVDDAESAIQTFTTSESLADFVNLFNAPSRVSSAELQLRGETAEHARLYVFVNRQENPQAQVMIQELANDQFDVTVTLDAHSNYGGIAGNSLVEIMSWNAAGVKSVSAFEVVYDTGGPLLSVNEIPTYINAREVVVSGLTDPLTEVEFYLREASQGKVLADGEGYFEKEVNVGGVTQAHLLRVVARDAAGNENVFEQEIYVDNKNPAIQFYTSFTAPTHYKLFRVEGKTKPEAVVSVRNFGEYRGCTDNEFLDRYGSCDSVADVGGPGPDTSISTALDPLNFVYDTGNYVLGGKITATADAYGNFSILVPLFGPEMDHNVNQYGETPAYTRTIGTNNLVFNVTDLAGNEGTVSKTVKYEPGCVDWRIGKVTSIPTNIYTEDLAVDNLQTSAIIELDYIGPGSPEYVDISITEDRSGGQLFTESLSIPSAEDEAKGPLHQQGILRHSYSTTFGGLENRNDLMRVGRFKPTPYDENKRKIYVYVPLIFTRYDGAPEDLPDQVASYLDAKISYRTEGTGNYYSGGGQEGKCNLYPVTSFVIQKPEDVSKWMSPEMINSTIGMLDKAINITEKGINISSFAAKWTTVACGVMVAGSFISSIGSVSSVGAGGQQTCDSNMKNVYAVCDRVLCPAVPPNCEGFEDKSKVKIGGETYAVSDQTVVDAQKKNDDLYATHQTDYDTWKADPANVGNSRNSFSNYIQAKGITGYQNMDRSYNYETTTPDGKEVSVEYYGLDDEIGNTKVSEFYKREIYGCKGSGDVQSIIVFKGLDEGQSSGWSIGGARSSESQEVYCHDKPVEQLEAPNDQDIPGCFSAECPAFDDTKCLLGNGYNLNPAQGLFSSLQCGCFPGVKSHLQNLLKILTGAKKCLEQAKIGETTAGFCKRLMSYFVCDILTEVFKYLFRSTGGGSSGGVLAGVMGRNMGARNTQSQDISNQLEGRYGDIISDRLGLSTDQLVNKACVAAFAADWSILEGAIDQVVETVEIAPVANIMATSRPYGFDPFTSRLNIGYNLYVGIVPGGQTQITAQLVCDETYPGNEYCVKGSGAGRIDLVNEGRVPAYLTKDSNLVDSNIFYIDQNAASWYNKLVLTLEYQVGGRTETQTIEKQITKKGDVGAFGCNFDPLQGFSCDIGLNFQDMQNSIPGGVQLFKLGQGSSLVPSAQQFFPGNEVSAVVKVKNDGREKSYLRLYTSQRELEYALDSPRHNGDERYYLVWLDGNDGTTDGQKAMNIDVLKDTNNNGQGDETYYSADVQSPQLQRFNIPYTFASAPTTNVGPSISIVEPVSVFEQQPSHYVNVGGTAIPLGIVVEDDHDAIASVSVEIVADSYVCKDVFTVDGAGMLSPTVGANCGLIVTGRSLGLSGVTSSSSSSSSSTITLAQGPQLPETIAGMTDAYPLISDDGTLVGYGSASHAGVVYDQQGAVIGSLSGGIVTLTGTSASVNNGRPSFVEWDIPKDGTNINDDPDTIYDITVTVADVSGVESAQKTRLRINPTDSAYAFTYEDMQLCLGSGLCNGVYGAGMVPTDLIGR
jgi:hypothetical protein